MYRVKCSSLNVYRDKLALVQCPGSPVDQRGLPLEMTDVVFSVDNSVGQMSLGDQVTRVGYLQRCIIPPLGYVRYITRVRIIY